MSTLPSVSRVFAVVHAVPLLLALAALPAASRAAGADWPCWRGPGSQGVSAEAGFPASLAPGQVAWEAPVPGSGLSSPIVAAGKVFLTTDHEGDVVPGAAAAPHTLDGKEFVHPESVGADRKHTLEVLCFELATGKLLWRAAAHEGTVYDARHRRGSFAAPTCATDGRRLFAYFGSEGVHAFDLDGKRLWSASVGKIATLGMGVGTSPVLHGELVLILRDEDLGAESSLVALRAESGEVAWRTPRPVSVSWSTPVLATQGGRSVLLASGNERLVAYDPATGAERWSAPGLGSHAIHTPLLGAGRAIFTTGYPQKRSLALDLEGAPRAAEAGSEGAGAPPVAWERPRGTGYVVSPILHRGLVYLVSDQGVVSCVEAATGETRYDDGRLPRPARFMASPVAYEERILLISERGDAFVLKAGPRFEVDSVTEVGEAVFASPALSGGRILVRGEGRLHCYMRPS